MFKNLTGLLVALLGAVSAFAQEMDTTMWVTDGMVKAIVHSGNTVYLSGDFTRVGPSIAHCAMLNTRDGRLSLPAMDRIHGTIKTSVPDGRGGWYIGGNLEKVGGLVRTGIAHIKADGQVDQDWDAGIGPLRSVVSTLVLVGNTLYVGGTFATVGGETRQNLTALDARTGRVTDWHCTTDGPVYAMAISGNTLYLGGDFSHVGSDRQGWQIRNDAAAVDATTGAVGDWHLDAGVAVRKLVVWERTVFVMGYFQWINGVYRPHLAAVDAVSGQLVNWDPAPDSYATDMMLSGNTLYVTGNFTQIAGQPRNCAAAFDASTGQLTPWAPRVNDRVESVAVAGGVAYLGGRFRGVDGQNRDYLAAVDAGTGALTTWNGGTNGEVYWVAASGDQVLVSGNFTSAGMQYRNRIAAINTGTGEATDWRASASVSLNTNITVIAADREKVYVSGWNNESNGQSRFFLDALDAATGTRTDWSPTIDGAIHASLLTGNTLYVGGGFTQINGQQRYRLAAIDVTTGQPTPWVPSLDQWGGVADIKFWKGIIYIAGKFTAVNGQPRYSLAALDATRGQLTDWNPSAVFDDGSGMFYNQTLYTLGFSETTLYAGGSFYASGQHPRRNAIAFDLTTAQVTPWSPAVKNVVNDLIVSGDLVYLSGFDELNNQSSHLAAVDRAVGQTIRWESRVGDRVLALTLHEGTLYAGGYFYTVQGRIRPYFVAFDERPARGSLVQGKVYEDTNGNCLQDDTERGIPYQIVVAQPGNYFASTDSTGNYTIRVDTGRYSIAQVIPADRAAMVRQVCPVNPAVYQVRFSRYDSTVTGKDFANQTDLRPHLSVAVSSDRRRRCFTGITTVSYCNAGSATAQHVQVYVQLPEHVVLVSAGHPHTKDREGNYVFSIGALAAGSCGTIQLVDSVVCNNPDIRGLTQCTKAWITPPNGRTPDPEWDRSDITLKARCQSNGRVRLALSNTGTGSMADSSAYRIYLDAQLAFTRNFKLAHGDSLVLQVPANGRTVRLEADQRPAHPDKRQSNITIEGCGTNTGGTVSKGFVCQFPQDDEEPEVAVECLPIIDSFDPNDKAVSPQGVTDQHYTPTGRTLDYVIRFQNTGTDVAYEVVVVDTLSEHLDMGTLRVGAVSHPYQMRVSGKGRPVLTFTFKDINLPDSTANEPLSHGRIQLSIKPKADLPEKTRVENFADIFFDYNEPVRTNTTVNTLYDLPPVVADAVALAPSDVCPAVNTVAVAGANRVVCAQDTVGLRAGQPSEGNGRWRVVKGAGTIAETNRPDATVTGLAYGENVFEWRVPTSRCRTDSVAATVAVTRLQKPIPVIAQLGADQLVCSVAGSRYEWFRDGVKLDGQGPQIQVTAPGRYTVRVETPEGCNSDLSEAYAYGVTGLGPGATAAVRVFPNPTSGRLVIDVPLAQAGPVHVLVVDNIGRTVLTQTFRHSGRAGAFRAELDLSAQATGLYVLKLQTGGALIVRSVFKK